MAQQDLSVSLIGKDVSASDAFRALARAANQAAKSAGDSLDSMNRRVESSSQNTLRATTSSFGSGLASWAQSGLAGVLGGIAASVTSTVTNVLSDAGTAIMSQLKTSVIDYNAQLEQATIGFTTMLGSGTKAAGFLKELQQFAKTTPFEFGDLTSYAQQMMAYGISTKNVIPYLTALGDAAAGAGKSGDELGNAVLAFEQMAARGKVDLGDLNQLTNAGVPALAVLAEKYGVTKGELLKLISTGKVASSDALPKLIAGLEKGTKATAAFGGMMGKQSATFNGAMSNISDAMNQTLSTAFKPFYQVAERAALALADFAGSNKITEWAANTSKVVGKFIDQFGAMFARVGKDKTLRASFTRLAASAREAFGQIGPAIQKALPYIETFIREAGPSIVDAITATVRVGGQLIKFLGDVSPYLIVAGNDIRNTITTFNGLTRGIGDTIAAIGRFVNEATPKFGRFATDAAAALGGLPGRFLQMGSDAVQGLINGITSRAADVINTVTGLARQVSNPFFKALQFGSPSKLFRKYGGWVGQGLNQGLLGTTSQIAAASSAMATAVRSAFTNKQISRATEQSGLAQIKAMTDANSRLSKLAKQRADLQTKISDLKSARSGVYNDVTTATRGYGDVTGFAYPGDAVYGLQQLVAKTRTFTTDLKALSKKGVSGTMLQQLVEGWNTDPDTALSTANGLLANPGDLRQILALNKQLASAGASLGSYASHEQYDSQINAASGKSKVLGWQMQAAARSGLQAVSRDLHVHVNVNGTYAGTKDDLAKSIQSVIRDAIRKGTIPKNWATA